ncbi:MAG: DUF1501 domain-containing protein, partial [Phycisphaerae bacterium]|nr:DUF1501 domain-containing protein [Phycisphaerae bacterium]
MDPIREHQQNMTRRQLFGRGALGLGTPALASLLNPSTAGAGVRPVGLPGLPHAAAKAKRVIYLFMNGAPTHVDMFDWKPKIAQLHGKPVPKEYIGGKRFSTMTGKAEGKLMLAPIEPFKQHGQSGAWVSALMP